jgi:hypothetical protein
LVPPGLKQNLVSVDSDIAIWVDQEHIHISSPGAIWRYLAHLYMGMYWLKNGADYA